MSTLDSTGFTRTRLDERLLQLIAAMRAIFGEDLDLDPDTIDGQTIGIFSESISDTDQLIEDVYHGFNPQTATGTALSHIVQFNSIKRISGAFSTVILRCIGTEGTLIPANSLVRSEVTNTQFQTIADAIIGAAGFVDIPSQSALQGFYPAPANTITKIDSPIFGWLTCSNLLDAITGRFEETDSELRIRRRVSTSTAGTNTIDSIYGTLRQLPNVLQARVYENELDTFQPVTNLPPHSIYCIVEGGAVSEIALSIWQKKSAGSSMFGLINQVIQDSQNNPHNIKFSRPFYADVFIVINLSIRPGWPSDGTSRIKAALSAWGLANQEIGEELVQSRLFDPANTVPGHSIADMFIGLAAAPNSENNIPVAFDFLIRIDTSRIVVNII